MSNEARSKKTVEKTEKDKVMKDTELEKALAQNDEEWMKRMLLLVLTMIIAILGID